MRELRDREHEHEVEEQLDEGDARVAIARAQQASGLVQGGTSQEREVCQKLGSATFQRPS